MASSISTWPEPGSHTTLHTEKFWMFGEKGANRVCMFLKFASRSIEAKPPTSCCSAFFFSRPCCCMFASQIAWDSMRQNSLGVVIFFCLLSLCMCVGVACSSSCFRSHMWLRTDTVIGIGGGVAFVYRKVKVFHEIHSENFKCMHNIEIDIEIKVIL